MAGSFERPAMQRTEATAETEGVPECGAAHLGQLSVRLARLYRAWLRLALALLALGLVLDVFEDGRLEQATVPLGALPEQLFRGDPAAFESLAMLVAVLGPVCGLLLMLVTCVRRGDRRTASLAALVLVVVAVLPVARSLGGR